MSTPSKPVEVRRHLMDALRADLVGPFLLGHSDPNAPERLPLPPSRWYLTGFLAPEEAREPEESDDTDAGMPTAGDDDTESPAAEPEAKKKSLFPASMGLSVLIPEGSVTDIARVTITFADYEAEEESGPDDTEPRRRPTWVRRARGPISMDVLIDRKKLAAGFPVPGFPGLTIKGDVEPTAAPGVPKDARSLALFLVNHRQRGPQQREDEAFVFQVALQITFDKGFIARPNLRGEEADDWDERVADLQFRDNCEYAVGHGVSAEPVSVDGKVVAIRTTWIPTATVRRVESSGRDVDGNLITDVMIGMDDLAALSDGAAAREHLAPLVVHYRRWIEAQQSKKPDTPRRNETAKGLAERAERAARRIDAGIAVLAGDPLAFDAFRIANRAMAVAARRRSPERYTEGNQPTWRLFQLAFVLLNLPGLTDDSHEDRETVELIFFPTGGGKTEAYLGVIAFKLVLRRLHAISRVDGGLGTAVILRYTLRLLTLDQLGRAATLICALERIRKDDARLGRIRFSLGLWVGKSATANTLAEVARRITDYRNSSSAAAHSPFPLPACPWCGKPLSKESLELRPNRSSPEEVLVGCSDFRCDFAAAKNPEGLPVLFVDEQIYQELPSFIVATVDKFAMMPWRGETGAFFGRVHSRIDRRFFGPMDGPVPPPNAERLPEGLRPPDLIIQDELHLISGPLGTMVGLYETAVEGLSLRTQSDGRVVRPKIIASTATVRRADRQIRALFGRTETAVFPPPGVDQSESFFASIDGQSAGREYLGVAAPGRSMKAIMLRVYISLLGASNRWFDPKSPANQPADPYMTLVGYFNSLRELGGMRRLVEDEVRSRCLKLEDRRPVDFVGKHPWFAGRDIRVEPIELTSRESTHNITRAKDLLSRNHTDDQHVDVALASNMISVGVDIERLGLMVIGGQPKSTSEYIQSSSRVGRDGERPGLVVTVFNTHRSRDRSHYERFQSYHESFYRFVEATSVTPFSGPALDRGLCGTLVALARLNNPALTAPNSVRMLEALRSTAGEAAITILEERARRQPVRGGTEGEKAMGDAIRARSKNLLDAWQGIVRSATESAGERVYSQYDRECRNRKSLLHTILEDDPDVVSDEEKKFSAPTSMRDVEASVHLWIARRQLTTKGPDHG